MSFFSGTATLYHVTTLPPTASFHSAVARLHNHEMLIKFDPDLSSWETLPADPSAPDTARYKISDNMNAIPKILGTQVTYESHMTDLPDGIELLINAPLGMVQKATWRILKTADVEKEGKAEEGAWMEEGERGEWCLVEEGTITANKVILGTVKGKSEQNWRGSHRTFVKGLEGGEAAA